MGADDGFNDSVDNQVDNLIDELNDLVLKSKKTTESRYAEECSQQEDLVCSSADRGSTNGVAAVYEQKDV